jgi:CheY-like chemotaxis protein
MDLTVLFIGDRGHTEFHGAWKSLVTLARLVPADDAAAGLELLQGGLAVDVIVVAQGRPGQFDATAIDPLRRAAPSAVVIGLMGSWCAGDVRREIAWPGVPRVTWDRWDCEALPGFGQLLRGECPSWALPPTASDEERHLRRAAEPLPRRCGTIAVHAQNREMRNWLFDACAAGGYHAIALLRDANEGIRVSKSSGRLQAAQAVIWDCAAECPDDAARWRRWSQQLNGAPVLLLQSFPTPEVYIGAQQAGIAAVLSKPFGIADVLQKLESLCAISILTPVP